MTEIPRKPEQVTLENLSERRWKQASLREQKGKHQEALAEARAIRERLHEEVVDLYWEEYLIGKHMIMEARDKRGLWKMPTKAKEIVTGFVLMRDSAVKANTYIERHGVEEKRPRSGRFLGEIDMLSRRYNKAIDHFRGSIDLFNDSEEWNQRINALELSGFLVEALILSGKTQEGTQLAVKTFYLYDEGDGATLRENDYYTWAVWKSGCAIKMWHAILAKKLPIGAYERKGLGRLLDEAEEILVIPEGDETWGDKNFEIRKSEIEAIRREII